jgi:hypothetical protein
MAPSSPFAERRIDALAFDANRLSHHSDNSHRSLLDDDVSFMNELAEEILERDRARMRIEVIRIVSFICAVLSW